MNEISIGVIYLPISYKQLSFKELCNKIAKENKFDIDEFAENRHIILLSANKNIKIIVDVDGTVYYIKTIKEENFTSRQIFNIAKEGYEFIQESPLNKEYLKRLGLIIRGKEMLKFYAKKEEVIKDFGMKLFKKPSFNELEKTDFDIQMSIVSEEVPLLSFASNG